MSLTDLKPKLSRGIYLHYKGKEYEVLDIAQHSETMEYFVVYRPLYGDRDTWIRPLTMFTETINLEGQKVPRFKWIRESE